MSVTAQQIISGLYASFFNRAPDLDGLSYWEGRASGASDFNTFNEIASGFAGHPKFGDIYDSMSNQDFVEAIYVNTLGAEGDAEGIAFWTNDLNNGVSRSEMVATFVYSALNFDVNDSQWDSLSAEEKVNASGRKDAITNKADTGIYFVESFGENTNITDVNNLDNDTAYLASIEILGNITSAEGSVFDAMRIDGEVLFGSDFSSPMIPFTEEWLNGRSLYDYFEPYRGGDVTELDVNGDGILNDVATLSFDSGIATVLVGPDVFIGSYSILNSGILYLTINGEGAGFIKGFQVNGELNALEITWGDQLSDVENRTIQQAKEMDDFDYLFYDIESANSFIEIELSGVNEQASDVAL